MKKIITKYNSIISLKSNLEKEISDIEDIIQEYSDILGEKIRINEEISKDDPDFLELKSKFDDSENNPTTLPEITSNTPKNDKSKDEKKKTAKKKKKKKNQSDKWYDLNEIHIYNGVGLKGELELYFKALDELKSKLDNLRRCYGTLTSVIEKGLREDMGCIVFQGVGGVIEIAFLKSTGIRENYSLKSIYTGPAVHVENMIKIGV